MSFAFTALSSLSIFLTEAGDSCLCLSFRAWRWASLALIWSWIALIWLTFRCWPAVWATAGLTRIWLTCAWRFSTVACKLLSCLARSAWCAFKAFFSFSYVYSSFWISPVLTLSSVCFSEAMEKGLPRDFCRLPLAWSISPFISRNCCWWYFFSLASPVGDSAWIFLSSSVLPLRSPCIFFMFMVWVILSFGMAVGACSLATYIISETSALITAASSLTSFSLATSIAAAALAFLSPCSRMRTDWSFFSCGGQHVCSQQPPGSHPFSKQLSLLSAVAQNVFPW
mmetsp:Transcript_48768/g.110477  ORF Transcript_48768/g.110477 Transcript_48768/m.110477 type:complete len:283 (+) Transcript_48768:921-1769(+)